MARGSKPGEHRGGRKPGTPNKNTKRFKDLADSLGYTVGEALILAAANRMPCGTCGGKGKTRFQPINGAEPGERTCQSCWGSGFERISAKERAWADAECCQMIYPRLKAVELTGEAGGPIQAAVRVIYE